ncbi:hypothetical protein ACSBR2_011793 [Camellia fascicularis]
MEALWNLEDKLNLSTEEAVLIFACSAFLVVGLCTAAAIKRRARRKQLVGQEPSESESESESEDTEWLEPRLGCGSIKKALMGSVRWSNVSRWRESMSGSRKEGPIPLLVGRRREAEVGWQSHNSVSPVWQRPILMGEKCELPRFSGLILYDERGRPVHHSDQGTNHQEITTTVVRTTLRDFL